MPRHVTVKHQFARPHTGLLLGEAALKFGGIETNRVDLLQ